MIGEIQCVYTVWKRDVRAEGFPLVGMAHWDFSNDSSVPLRPDLKRPRTAANFHRNLVNTLTVEIFEARRSAVPQIGNVGKALLTIGRILGNAGEPAVHPVAGSASGKGRIPAEQVAGNVRRIFPAARKRPAIAATGGQLHLRDGSIWKDANRFQAALPAEICSVGVTVIENVPLPIDFFNTAVIVPAVKHGLVCRFIGINMQIAITDDYTGKSERAKRRAAAGIAEFMVRDRGVDEIIGIPCLPN